jgi:hypothetical protein
MFLLFFVLVLPALKNGKASPHTACPAHAFSINPFVAFSKYRLIVGYNS